MMGLLPGLMMMLKLILGTNAYGHYDAWTGSAGSTAGNDPAGTDADWNQCVRMPVLQ